MLRKISFWQETDSARTQKLFRHLSLFLYIEKYLQAQCRENFMDKGGPL